MQIINSLFLGLLDETLGQLRKLRAGVTVTMGDKTVRLATVKAKKLAQQLEAALSKVRSLLMCNREHADCHVALGQELYPFTSTLSVWLTRYPCGIRVVDCLPQRFEPELEGRNRALAVCMVLDPRTTRLEDGCGVSSEYKKLFTDAYREEAIRVRPLHAQPLPPPPCRIT